MDMQEERQLAEVEGNDEAPRPMQIDVLRVPPPQANYEVPWPRGFGDEDEDWIPEVLDPEEEDEEIPEPDEENDGQEWPINEEENWDVESQWNFDWRIGFDQNWYGNGYEELGGPDGACPSDEDPGSDEEEDMRVQFEQRQREWQLLRPWDE